MSWGGVFAPAGTPAPVVAMLHDHIVKVLAMPEVREKLEKMGVDIVASTPDEFASYLQSEIRKWSAVVKTAGVTVE